MNFGIKSRLFGVSLALVTASISTAGLALAAGPTTYVVNIRNGSGMAISPVLAYVQNGQVPESLVGRAPSLGFVSICETGNTMTRNQELSRNAYVTFKTQTTASIPAGESRTIEVQVNDPLNQSIQFETMYGRTKDLCAVAGVGSHSLYALKQHVTTSVFIKDNVVQTGAFLDPAIPKGQTYLDEARVCTSARDAISCLRSLSLPNTGAKKIRFFSGYLPSVSMLLEAKYGASEALGLMLPTSGAVEFEIKLKH